jgi:hypothetical protein
VRHVLVEYDYLSSTRSSTPQPISIRQVRKNYVRGTSIDYGLTGQLDEAELIETVGMSTITAHALDRRVENVARAGPMLDADLQFSGDWISWCGDMAKLTAL